MEADQKKFATQINEFTDLRSSLQVIQERMSTKPLGLFPAFLSPIEELISSARTSIRIVSPIPAPGIITVPTTWDRLRATMESKARSGVDVRFVSCERPVRSAQFDRQFERDKAAWVDVYPKKFRNFVAYHAPQIGARLVSPAELRELVLDVEERLLAQWGSLMKVRLISEGTPVWFWVADGRSAIVAIGNSSATGSAFYTQDASLVSALLALFERYEKETESAQPLTGHLAAPVQQTLG